MTNKRNTELAKKNEQVELATPSDFIGFATELKQLIVDNRLFTNIKGKNYVNVEGWQIAGAFTGTFPFVENVENLSEGDFYKYRAEVSLRDKDGNKVGYGVAICTNKESGKKNFDEYAVASMAQTRAVGKAYRMKIGWLLKIAGYETTPAEEMDAVVEGETVEKPRGDRLDFEELKGEIRVIYTESELLRHFNDTKKRYSLTEKQLVAVKKIYSDRKQEIRDAVLGKNTEFQKAVDEAQAKVDAMDDSSMDGYAATRDQLNHEAELEARREREIYE